MSKKKTQATSSANLETIKVGSRVRFIEDGTEGKITWANGMAIKIRWDDGEQVTWKRADLAIKGIKVLEAADETPPTELAATAEPPIPEQAPAIEPVAEPAPATPDQAATQTPGAETTADSEPPAATEPVAEQPPAAPEPTATIEQFPAEEQVTTATPEQPQAEPESVPTTVEQPQGEPETTTVTAESTETEPAAVPEPTGEQATPSTEVEAAPTVAKTQRQRKAPAAPKEKKVSALDAAAKVLAEAGQAMTCKEMIGVMASKGYWFSPGGQTPDATLYSAVFRKISTKGADARFTKSDRGKFARKA